MYFVAAVLVVLSGLFYAAGLHEIGSCGELEGHFRQAEMSGMQGLHHGERGPLLDFDLVLFESFAKARGETEDVQT